MIHSKTPKIFTGILSKDIVPLSILNYDQVEKYIVDLIESSNLRDIRQTTTDFMHGMCGKECWAYNMAEAMHLIPKTIDEYDTKTTSQINNNIK